MQQGNNVPHQEQKTNMANPNWSTSVLLSSFGLYKDKFPFQKKEEGKSTDHSSEVYNDFQFGYRCFNFHN